MNSCTLRSSISRANDKCIYNFDRYHQAVFHGEVTKMTLLPAKYDEPHTLTKSGAIRLFDLCCFKK